MDDGHPPAHIILVGIDGSLNAAAALAWSVEEAHARHAEIEAVFVAQVPGMAYGSPTYVPISEADVEAEAQAAFREASSAIPDGPEVTMRLRVTSGRAVEVINNAAHSAEVDLVVVGACGHGIVGALLLGSVSHGLAHHCPKPLVIVRAEWPAGASGATPEEIVVGVDGSPPSEQALEWAVQEASIRHAAVRAVMVTVDNIGVGDALQAIVDRLDDPGISVQCTVETGHPAHRLVELAAEAQLLVVGKRGLGPVRERVLGSVSRFCAQHSSVPVVIMPSDEQWHG